MSYPLCVLIARGPWTGRLDYPLIYMAQNNINSLMSGDAIWLQFLVIIGSGHGLSARYQDKSFCWLIQSSVSKQFWYFFQFLRLQVEEIYFFNEAIVIFTLRGRTCKQTYKWKVFILCPFILLFYLFMHFQTFSYFSSFFHIRRKKPISSRTPSQFPGSNELVNSNTIVKYWYSAHICCSLVLRITTSYQEKYYLFTHFQTFQNCLSQFRPLQVEETYFFQEVIAVSGFTSHGRNM